MSLHVVDKQTGADGFPRVSGDEPAAGGEAANVTLFSPRERG